MPQREFDRTPAKSYGSCWLSALPVRSGREYMGIRAWNAPDNNPADGFPSSGSTDHTGSTAFCALRAKARVAVSSASAAGHRRKALKASRRLPANYTHTMELEPKHHQVHYPLRQAIPPKTWRGLRVARKPAPHDADLSAKPK